MKSWADIINTTKIQLLSVQSIPWITFIEGLILMGVVGLILYYFHKKHKKLIGIIIISISIISLIIFFDVFLRNIPQNSYILEFFTLIIPIITIIIGFYGAWLAYSAAIDQIKSNAELNKEQIGSDLKKQITINRQDWIDHIRNLSVNFLDFASRVDNKLSKSERAEASKYIHEFHLYINPSDFLYNVIINIVNDIKTQYEGISYCYYMIEKTKQKIAKTNKAYLKRNKGYLIFQINFQKNKIISHNLESQKYREYMEQIMQCLLKAEWDRIKDILESNEMDKKDYYKFGIYYNLIPIIIKNKDARCYLLSKLDKNTTNKLIAKTYNRDIKNEEQSPEAAWKDILKDCHLINGKDIEEKCN